jgi:hypothetical protein
MTGKAGVRKGELDVTERCNFKLPRLKVKRTVEGETVKFSLALSEGSARIWVLCYDIIYGKPHPNLNYEGPTRIKLEGDFKWRDVVLTVFERTSTHCELLVELEGQYLFTCFGPL